MEKWRWVPAEGFGTGVTSPNGEMRRDSEAKYLYDITLILLSDIKFGTCGGCFLLYIVDYKLLKIRTISLNLYQYLWKIWKEKSWSERTCMNANHDLVLLLKHRYCLPSRQEKILWPYLR